MQTSSFDLRRPLGLWTRTLALILRSRTGRVADRRARGVGLGVQALAALAVLASPALAQTPHGLRNGYRIVTTTGTGSELLVDSGWQTTGPLVSPGNGSSSTPSGCASQGDCIATSDYGRLRCVGSGLANNCTTNGVFLYLDNNAAPATTQFSDTLTVVSNTLPVGTPVQVRYKLALSGQCTAQSAPHFLSFGATLANGAGGFLDQHDSAGTLSANFTVVVGAQYSIAGTLNVIVRVQSMLNLAPPVVVGAYDVDLQADMTFEALTSGVVLQFASGHDYSEAPRVYCTAGTSSLGCSASISANASPSVSAANPCNIAVAGVEGQKSGLLFYGINNGGFTPTQWAANSTSFLCVKAPTQRLPIQNSGGTPNSCNGSFALDWNAFQAGNPLALGNPWSAGAKVYVQAWFRDPPAPKSTTLSDALELTYVP